MPALLLRPTLGEQIETESCWRTIPSGLDRPSQLSTAILTSL